MNHNTHDIHELSYDLGHSRYSINYRSGADGFSSNQIIDDKEKDLNYMYSEFLKNDLDFSELPSHPQNKYEDNFFSLTQPRRNEFGQFGFETNKKSYDPFRPDREFDLEREMYRGRSLSGQFADNFEIPSSNVFQKLSDPMYYQGRHQNEINEVCAQEPAFLNQQSTTDSLSKFQEESLKDLEPSNAFKSQVQLKIMKSEEPRQNLESGVTIHSIKSKIDDDIAPTSSIGDRSEHFSYLQASINLSQPFSMQRKSSANEAQSTQVLSQSSVESPESKKKWVETSGALHSETVKKQKPEIQAQSKRGGGKKKLKTSSDVGEEVKPNTSQQMKPETSYNQMKQEFSANQFQREVSSHQLKQENSTTKRAQFQNLFESKSNAKQINTMNEGSSDLNHGRSQPNYNNMNALVNSQSSSDLMNNHMTNRPMMPSHLGEHTNYFQSAQTNSKASNYFPGYGLNNAQEHQQGWHQQNSQQQNSNQYTQQADLRQQQQLQFQRYQQMQTQFYQQQELQVQKTQNSYPQQSSQQNQYLQQQHLRNNVQKVSQNIQEQQQYPQDQYPRNLEQKTLQPQQSQQSQQSQQFLRPPLQQQQQQLPPQYSQYHQPRSQEFSQSQSHYNQQQYYQQQLQQQGQTHTWQPQQELQQSRSSSNQRMTETHSQNQQESQLNPNQSHQYRQQPHYLNNQQGGQQQPHHFSSQMIQQASHFNAQQHTTSQQQNFQTQNFTPDRQQSSNNIRSDLQVQPIHYQTQQTPHPNTTQQIAPFREQINTQTNNPANHPQLPKLNNLRQLQPASITKSVSLPNKNITQELVKNNLPIQPETVKSIKNTHLLEKIQSSQTRRIGPLTQEERKAKVARYLEKRKQRFRVEKKSYPARKKVASNRPRVKGRFATQSNASQVNEINGLSQTQANTHAQDNRNMTTASYENAPVFNSMLDSPFQSLNQDGGKGYLLSSEFDPRYDPFFD